MTALSFLNLKFIHLFFLLFWSGYVLMLKNQTKLKLIQWIVFLSSFLVMALSGFLLLFKVGILVDSLYPLWVKLKLIGTLIFFLITVFQLKYRKLSDHIFNLIFFLFCALITYFSVFRVYL